MENEIFQLWNIYHLSRSYSSCKDVSAIKCTSKLSVIVMFGYFSVAFPYLFIYLSINHFSYSPISFASHLLSSKATSTSFSSAPRHICSFPFRKVEAFHVYQPAMEYQVAARLGTFSLIEPGQGNPDEGSSRQQSQRQPLFLLPEVPQEDQATQQQLICKGPRSVPGKVLWLVVQCLWASMSPGQLTLSLLQVSVVPLAPITVPLFYLVAQGPSNVWLWVSSSLPISFWVKASQDNWSRQQSMSIGICEFRNHFTDQYWFFFGSNVLFYPRSQVCSVSWSWSSRH